MNPRDWNLWLGRSLVEISSGRPQFHLFSTYNGSILPIPPDIDGKQPIILNFKSNREVFEPYAPFLGWIRELIPLDISPEALLEEAGVYHFQRPVFIRYFWGIEIEREEVLPYEEKWERDQFQLSVWNLFSRVLDGRFAVCVFENAQELPFSTLSAIISWKERDIRGRVLLLFAQEKDVEPPHGPRADLWSRFSDTMGSWKQYGIQEGVSKTAGRSKRYSMRDLDLSLKHLHFLQDFFCLEEAEELANRLYGFYLRHTRGFQANILLLLLNSLGNLYYSMGKPLQAVHFYAHILTLLPTVEFSERSRVTRLIAQCFLILREDQKANALSLRSFELAQQSCDLKTIFYSLHVRLWAEQHLQTLSPDEWKKDFRKYLELGQELDLSNSLAFWLVNPYLMDSVEQISEATYYQQWGIELCEKYKNFFLLSYGYLNIGYYWSIKGEYEKVLDSYQKSEDLKNRIHRLEELPQVFNSRGYFLMSIGDYEKAQDNFLKALSGLYRYRSSVEIGLTLFNLAMNAFNAEIWERAEQDFSRVLSFMRGLDISSLIYHGRREVLIYLGLCQVNVGHLTRLLETWMKVSQETANTANWEEQLLYSLLRAHVVYHEGGIEMIPQLYKEAEAFLNLHKTDLRFRVPWFYFYYGRILDSAGYKTLAESTWKQGYLESFQLPNSPIRAKLQSALNPAKGEEFPPYLLSEPGETVEWIVDLARQYKQQREVQKNKASLDVLLSFQELLAGLGSSDEILQDTARLIERGFLFDGIVLFENIAGYPKTLWKSLSLEEEGVELFRRLSPDFRSQGSQFVVHDLSLPPWDIKELHPSFGVVSVGADFFGEFSIQLIARFALNFTYSVHELRILQLMVTQLATTLGRKRREQHLFDENLILRKAAHKDVLTGLFNRRGITEKIHEEVSRLMRYEKGTCTILLVEILNIEEVNKEGGFHSGDAVLKTGALMLNRIVRAVDSVGRLGGSIFCLMLPETSDEGSINLVNRIQEKFIEVYKQAVASGALVESTLPQVPLSLCFGVAEWRGLEENLLDRASAALKSASKMDVKFYIDKGETSSR